MSRPILAKRSGVSLATVNRILGGDEDSAILSNLIALAQALGMAVSISNLSSEKDFAEEQAKNKAEAIARMVQGTSALESQAVDSETYEEIIHQTVHELMAGSRRKLWS
ncbi:MAG: hypothetical protein JXB10_09245 [Pirellulales bacterium]|nr:hypothetical protein [Pirellulales bacterium]